MLVSARARGHGPPNHKSLGEMRPDTLPIILIAAFLAAGGSFHLVAPAHSESLFSRTGPVRFVGAMLSLLGTWCVAFSGVINHLVGLPILLSGLARLLAPNRMIRLNTWTSRHTHGGLMLLGAIGCVWLVFA